MQFGGGFRKFGIAWVGHVGREIEQGLLAVSKVRGDDEFAGVGRGRGACGCARSRPGTVSVAEVRIDGRDGLEEQFVEQLGDVDGRGLEEGGAGIASAFGRDAGGGFVGVHAAKRVRRSIQ